MMSAFFRVAWHVVRKDLTVEVRSREMLSTTLFFAVSVVLVFSFALVREGRAPDDVAPGSCGSRSRSPARWRWAAPSSASARTTRCARCCWRRRDRPAIYVGKLLGILLLLVLVEIVLVPLVGLLFQAPSSAHPRLLAALLVAGTLGFAAVGTLFAAMLVRARSRDVLLPILLYPITIPVIIAGVRGTAALLQPTPDLADGAVLDWRCSCSSTRSS